MVNEQAIQSCSLVLITPACLRHANRSWNLFIITSDIDTGDLFDCKMERCALIAKILKFHALQINLMAFGVGAPSFFIIRMLVCINNVSE